MNQFAVALISLIERNQTNKRKLSEATGIDTSSMSKLCRGDLDPTIPVLKSLCQHISMRERDRAELLIARLRDIVSDVGVNPAAVNIDHSDSIVWLPENLDPALTNLLCKLAAACSSVPELRDLLQSCYDCVRPMAERGNNNLLDRLESHDQAAEQDAQTARIRSRANGS